MIITPTQLLELLSFELELIEAVINAVAQRKKLVTLQAKLVADEIIGACLEVHAYQSRN
jgi:hypothetical protein